MSFWVRIALVIKTCAPAISIDADVPREHKKWFNGLGRSGKKEGNIVGVENAAHDSAAGNFLWVFMQPDHEHPVSVAFELELGQLPPAS